MVKNITGIIPVTCINDDVPVSDEQYRFMPLPQLVVAGNEPAALTSLLAGSLTFNSVITDDPAISGVNAAAQAVALEILRWLYQALTGDAVQAEHYPVYCLSAAQQAQSQVLDEMLAEGEVSAKIRHASGETHIQETRFAGVWRVRQFDQQQQQLADRLEVCPLPACVWQQAATVAAGGAIALPETITLPETIDGMMNGSFVVHEICSQLRQPASESYLINLTLLPMNEADMRYLEAFFGEGNSALFSRGYGKCRIVSSQYGGLWRIHYFNDNNVLLQDLIEITRIPEIVLASGEDFVTSAQRIGESVSWLAAACEAVPPAAGNNISDDTILNGTISNNANADNSMTEADNARMECKICCWVYDPALGDDVWQIPPATPFRLLPPHWRCPGCDADKSGFILLADE